VGVLPSRRSLLSLDRSQILESLQNEVSRIDEIDDELLIDVDGALIFGAVSSLVTEGEDSPDLVTHSQRVRKALEDEVSILRAISMITKRCERKGVRSVVGEIETALSGQRRHTSVIEPQSPRANEPIELLLVGGLKFQAANPRQALQVFRR